jgi:diadenylate cyclase
MFVEALNLLRHITILDILDIVLIAIMIYSLMVMIKDTKAYQAALGMVLLALVYLLTVYGHLSVSNRIIRYFINYLIIAVIILFQGEIRLFLAGIGSRTFRRPLALRSFEEKLEDLFFAIDYMSQKRIGALIAIEKEVSLLPYVNRGVKLDALLSKDLLVGIFFPHSPLHDGAVVIRGDKVSAAGCLLPLPAAHKLAATFKTRTRHLAAIGLSEETDAAVIVISEETGDMSLAIKGRLEHFEDSEAMSKRLMSYLRN